MDWSVNFWAVLVAAVVSFVLGWLWFSIFFGKAWMKLANIKMKKGVNPLPSMIGGFLVNIVSAYALAVILASLGGAGWLLGLTVGLVVGIGLIAMNSMGMILWEGKPFALYALVTSYDILSCVVMGVIIAVW